MAAKKKANPRGGASPRGVFPSRLSDRLFMRRLRVIKFKPLGYREAKPVQSMVHWKFDDGYTPYDIPEIQVVQALDRQRREHEKLQQHRRLTLEEKEREQHEAATAHGEKGGRPSKKTMMNVDLVRRYGELKACGSDAEARAELVRQLMKETGCVESTANRWLNAAGIQK